MIGRAMVASLATDPPDSIAPPRAAPFGWRRLLVVLAASLFVSGPISTMWSGSYALLLLRLLLTGLLLLAVFATLGRWPARLPGSWQRWTLQLVGVAVLAPVAVGLAYALTSWGYADSFWSSPSRLRGYGIVVAFTLLAAPWIAMVALLRQVSGEARHRALAFALERSQLERQALDARMRVLQAQVEPHFLFNTLANVRELVASGSPQASTVLSSLIAYLRAAVPRLHGPPATLAEEFELVRAYLEVMQMRMPDRLQFVLQADPAVARIPFPPMALLTLVENAVRHGIDPAEAGGRIEVRASADGARVRVQVLDTGVGLRSAGTGGAGTGLANLRERMRLVFGDDASLRLSPLSPHGVVAELEFRLDAAAPGAGTGAS
jgi:signal transduction histidine kinase